MGRKLRTAAWLAWERRRVSLRRTLMSVQADPGRHGDKWVEKSSAHYEKLLKAHLTREPEKYLE